MLLAQVSALQNMYQKIDLFFAKKIDIPIQVYIHLFIQIA